ncbi:hypothetical protein AFE_2230 [Acidithiobacillus ferrooxidans ATCC 23270]|uniref:Uncharacterized protein n=1 Tax=Acidithiobacillus ferrooxidans (strain ATCC 23270 / DSM 14882 / CIP 104768 / NCIMB 8455) TaxID=243159 RepID=B7J5L7_ACIF2|nr:hypothetical protein AFE_2230 [Acidithiobacillus ferrooxidans ATCC 23270]
MRAGCWPVLTQEVGMEFVYFFIVVGFFLASIGVVELLDRLRSIK